MKVLITRVIGLYLFLLATQTDAVTLSLEPATSTAGVGDSVSLDLVIDGLGDYTSDSLGDFDIDIAYDSAVLSFEGYNLGGYLGDLGLFEAFDYSLGGYAPGSIGLTEVSSLEVSELDALQAGSFALATLDFTVNLLAKNAMTFVSINRVWALGDSKGNWLSVDGTSDAVITGVPEPMGLVLLGMGLACLGLIYWKSNAKQRSEPSLVVGLMIWQKRSSMKRLN
jgi:hypothetical protein